MGTTSSLLTSSELVGFEELPAESTVQDDDILKRSINRKRTNFKWLLFLAIFIAIWLPFMGHSMYYSHLGILFNGDNTGGNMIARSRSERNVWTSYNNEQYYTNLIPIDQLSSVNAQSGTTSEGVTTSSRSSALWALFICSLISILVTAVMFMLFRHATGCLIWSMIVSIMIALYIILIIFWIYYFQANEDMKNILFYGGLILTVCVKILLIVIIYLRHKIKFTIKIIQEASIIIFDMPLLISIPVINFLTTAALTVIFGVILSCMVTSGNWISQSSDHVITSVLSFTIIYTFSVYSWLYRIIGAIEYMIVAGAVANRYFTRARSYRKHHILTAVRNVFKFHLGTCVFGSFVIWMVAIAKFIILRALKRVVFRCLIRHTVEAVERIVSFLTRNAYIICAIHGDPFISSGKQAATLLKEHLGNIIALNVISKLVLWITRLLIPVVSGLISLGISEVLPVEILMTRPNFIMIITGFAAVISVFAFSVFDCTIDTVFVCYCEDMRSNDGDSKPYYMTSNLMLVIEDSRKVYEKQIDNTTDNKNII